MRSLHTLLCAALQVGCCLAFLRFHFGGVKEQVDFSLLDYHLSLFYTQRSVFSFESCQCAGKCGFWNVHHLEDLDILTAYFVKILRMAVICHCLDLFMVYLDFLSEDITQDESCNVYGFSEMFLLDVFLMTVSSRCLVALFQ